MKDYSKRLENIRSRRQDLLTKAYSVSEGFNKKTYGETVTYVLEAMEPIKKEYTQNTYKACEKVQAHLTPGLKEYGIDVDYRYQGSVPTDTHIKNYSDIDMLVIHQSFITLQPPQVPQNPYKGNPVDELVVMRQQMFTILDAVYSAATIDDSGSKAMNISGGSLDRSIDLISCNWFDSVRYSETDDEDYRGINVLCWDKKQDLRSRIVNYPFLHIYWINYKDTQTLGNAKRLIRFLKTIKVDADQEIKVSSYDIASLVFRMDDHQLLLTDSKSLLLLQNCDSYFEKILNDSTFRENLWVPNMTRRIFASDGVSIDEFKKLKAELKEIINDIIKDVKPLFENLERAETYYRVRI